MANFLHYFPDTSDPDDWVDRHSTTSTDATVLVKSSEMSGAISYDTLDTLFNVSREAL